MIGFLRSTIIKGVVLETSCQFMLVDSTLTDISNCCRAEKGVKRKRSRIWMKMTRVLPKEIHTSGVLLLFFGLYFFALLHDRHFSDDWMSKPLKCLWFSARLCKQLTFYFFTSLPKWRCGTPVHTSSTTHMGSIFVWVQLLIYHSHK